jgi:hypothetical protein
MMWRLFYPEVDLGYLPLFVSDANPRPAREQINEGYAHGGGWQPTRGFEMDGRGRLLYPGDPPMRPLAEAWLRDERLVFYEHAWLAIIQKDGTFEAARVD